MALPRGCILVERDTGARYRFLDYVKSPHETDESSEPGELTHLVVISLDDAKALPEPWPAHRVKDQIACERLLFADDECPPLHVESLTTAQKEKWTNRQAVLERLLEIGSAIYDPARRGKRIEELARQGIASKPLSYKVLHAYFTSGCKLQGLIPNFHLCGAPGVSRDSAKDAPKRGRPRTITPGEGINVDEGTAHLMRVVFGLVPIGAGGWTVRAAWELFLIRYFWDEVQIVPGDRVKPWRKYLPIPQSSSAGADNDAVRGSALRKAELRPNYDAVPTFEQFDYQYRKHIGERERIRRRRGKEAYKQLYAQLTTGTLSEVSGPGYRYYVDATVLDVYCVSRLNRNRIIGRPTLYLIVDQFSRLVVGMHVGLEPPCWVGALLALYNACLDKVNFCRTYGIEISSDDWPTGYIPVRLMGDRAELMSEQAESLSRAFNMAVENARAYAGDAKGCVERSLGGVQCKFGPYAPGYVDKKFAGKDAEPAALQAALNIHEVTRVVIEAVLDWNLRIVRDLEIPTAAVAAGVPACPLDLWHWGCHTLRFDARQYPLGYIRQALWPKQTLFSSRKGLRFGKGLYFQGEVVADWASPAELISQDAGLTAYYNPADISSIQVVPPNARHGLVPSSLTRRSVRFAGVTYSEVAALDHQRRLNDAAAFWDSLAERLDHVKSMHQTIAHARRQRASELAPTESKSARLQGIKDNKRIEIEHMQAEADAAQLAPVESRKEAPVTDSDDHGANAAVRMLMANRRRA